ncbi:MAG: hypothetical protein WKF71_16680 [Pyrinomonadaceae bacterium]
MKTEIRKTSSATALRQKNWVRLQSYTDVTEIAQQMRRGDETKGDPNERDVVGAPNAATQTDNQPVPRHQNAKSDLIKKDKEQ